MDLLEGLAWLKMSFCFLIYIAVVVGLVWLIIWVLGQLGINLPEPVKKVMWVIAVLIVLLLLWRAFSPILGASGGSLRMFSR